MKAKVTYLAAAPQKASVGQNELYARCVKLKKDFQLITKEPDPTPILRLSISERVFM